MSDNNFLLYFQLFFVGFRHTSRVSSPLLRVRLSCASFSIVSVIRKRNILVIADAGT